MDQTKSSRKNTRCGDGLATEDGGDGLDVEVRLVCPLRLVIYPSVVSLHSIAMSLMIVVDKLSKSVLLRCCFLLLVCVWMLMKCIGFFDLRGKPEQHEPPAPTKKERETRRRAVMFFAGIGSLLLFLLGDLLWLLK